MCAREDHSASRGSIEVLSLARNGTRSCVVMSRASTEAIEASNHVATDLITLNKLS